jgi:hypothetical protein
MDRLIDEPAPLILLQRTVARNQTKMMAQRNRAAALNASDFNMLAQIDSTINRIKMQALAGFMDFGIAKIWVDELISIRLEIVLPMDVFVSVWTAEKNRTIDSIEMGDDEISSTFIAHRAQLKELFASLAAPELLEIKTQRAGYCASEFAFLAWLWHSVHDISFISLQSQFHMEWSRLAKCVSTFQAWFFSTHSFRVTNAFHFWAPNVQRFTLL